MGTSGRGHLTDYQRKGEGGSGDNCSEAITTTLEEVERSEYFIANKSLPKEQMQISVRVNQRIEALADNGQVIGFLPTKYSYLASCIKAGYSYQGVLSSSTLEPLVRVGVIINPKSPDEQKK